MMRVLRRVAGVVALVAVGALGLSGCAASDDAGSGPAGNGDHPLQVVTTFSVLADLAGAIGGDLVEVHSIVPLGVDPHEYSPLPLDVHKATQAQAIIWNGLNMEVGGGWFEALVEIAGKDLDSGQVIEASRGVDPEYLTAGDGTGSEINPHAFLSPRVGMVYAQNIRDGLIGVDPQNEAVYTANAQAYLDELAEIDELYRDRIAQIPAQHRVLVASEYAFQYMAAQYGLRPGYIWEIDTDEQGTPEQMNNLITLIRETGVPALFVESNVDPRPMESISAETGVPIHGTIYSDELGSPDSNGGTYLKMLRHNITQIHEGLS